MSTTGENKVFVIILAAGKSERFGLNKLEKELCDGQNILDYTKSRFVKHKNVVIVGKDLEGGKTRQDSVFKGLRYLQEKFAPQENDIILIHNAANPLVTEKEIDECISAAGKYGAAIVAHPLVDTIKVTKGSKILKTIPRDGLFAAQTPQAFKWKIIFEAKKNAEAKGLETTDDASLVEAIGHEVYVIPASEHNKKITFKADLDYAKALIGASSQNFKIGIGQDSHRFDDLKKGLCLGGVKFEEYKALDANSDGDLILHALINAINSALGEGSISQIADSLCEKGIKDSKEYLKVSFEKMQSVGLKVNNVSISLEGAYPKLEPLIPETKDSIAKLLSISIHAIGITVTSGEKLTPFGEGKGLQCIAAVTLLDAH